MRINTNILPNNQNKAPKKLSKTGNLQKAYNESALSVTPLLSTKGKAGMWNSKCGCANAEAFGVLAESLEVLLLPAEDVSTCQLVFCWKNMEGVCDRTGCYSALLCSIAWLGKAGRTMSLPLPWRLLCLATEGNSQSVCPIEVLKPSPSVTTAACLQTGLVRFCRPCLCKDSRQLEKRLPTCRNSGCSQRYFNNFLIKIHGVITKKKDWLNKMVTRSLTQLTCLATLTTWSDTIPVISWTVL